MIQKTAKTAKTAPERTPRPRPVSVVTPVEARKLAVWAAEAGLDKKAGDVEIVDVIGKVDYADYLVLMTGLSDRHVSSIAEGVVSALKAKGVRPLSVEGLGRGDWVLLDFVDIVIHVFRSETRSLYDLDGLWMDAGRLPVPVAMA